MSRPQSGVSRHPPRPIVLTFGDISPRAHIVDSGARAVAQASPCARVRLCGAVVQAHGSHDYWRAVTGARAKPLMRAERASRH